MEEARQHSTLTPPPGHPDARGFAADRLLESERLALAMAGAPLALLLTQIGTIAASPEWVRALASLAMLCFIYCCIWQVHIVTYATYWLAGERLGDDRVEGSGALVGRGLLRAFRVRESYTEEGLIRHISRSKLHYSVAYWLGGGAGLAAAMGVIWA